MFRAGSKWFLVTALVLSLGFHWGILQSAAWVGMIVKYSDGSSLTEAVEKTFDGKHPCQLCKIVRAGKQAEKKSDAQFDLKKLDFFTAGESADFYFPPLRCGFLETFIFFPVRLEPPLAPPPRPFPV